MYTAPACTKAGSLLEDTRPSSREFIKWGQFRQRVREGRWTVGPTGHRAAVHTSHGLLLPPSRLTHLLLKSACKLQLSRTTCFCFLSVATGAPHESP